MRLKYPLGCVVALILACIGGHVRAQSADNKDISVTSACTDIDFMAGTWEVRAADGTLDATVRIDLGKGHCSSTELWSFTKVFGGAHVNCVMVYANRQHDWARLCSGFGDGDRYRSSGGKLSGNEIRFVHDDNATVEGVMQSLRLVNLPDKRIREIISESSDGGKSWKTIDDTYYSRKK